MDLQFEFQDDCPSDIRLIVEAQVRAAMHRQAEHLEEQARIFLRMGYAADELTMLVHRFHKNIPDAIVPISALELP